MSDKRSPVKAFSLTKTKGQVRKRIETGFHFLQKKIPPDFSRICLRKCTRLPVCLSVKTDRVNRLVSSNHAFCNQNLLRIAHTFPTLFLLKLSTHITQTICIELVTTLNKHKSNQFRQVCLSALFFKSLQ